MLARLLDFTSIGLIFALVAGARLLGPGDLYDKDQPKTLSASADVVLSGNWTWPRDMLHEPATKPPLYNWLDAPILFLAPVWDEWVFKIPSILASIVVAMAIARSTTRLLSDSPDRETIALLAVAIWFASAPTMKQLYLSRPDMLMVAFLFGAWCFANGSTSRFAPTAFWLCVTGAALAKGTPALLAVAYVPLAAWLIPTLGAPSRRLLLNWNALIFIALVGGWMLLAYRQRPDAFFAYFWNEGGTRFTTGGPESIAKPIYLPALWFANHFKPWSLFAVIGVLLLGWRNILRHPLSPAILWCALVLVVFSLIPGKRADYLLPAYPTCAILAAYGAIRSLEVVRFPRKTAYLLPFAMAIYLAHFELTRSPEAKSGDTRHLVAFARELRTKVQPGERVVFLVKGYHPLLGLLRRYDGNRASADDFTTGVWVVAPLDDRWQAHAVSEPLPNVIQTGPRQLVPGVVALYRIGDARGPTRDDLLPILASQYEWNFPADRLRVTRDPASR